MLKEKTIKLHPSDKQSMINVSLIWLPTGIALMVLSVIDFLLVLALSGINDGGFSETLISAGFSILCIMGSLCLMFKKAWGKILLLLAAGISFLYSVQYILFGDIEITGGNHALIVAWLTILSIVTIIVLLRKKECKTEQSISLSNR
jgi:hypothetical protein